MRRKVDGSAMLLHYIYLKEHTHKALLLVRADSGFEPW